MTSSDYRAPWWLKSAHLQTIFATLFRHRPALALRRERIELDDGDFLDLDWGPRAHGPVVLVLTPATHGIWRMSFAISAPAAMCPHWPPSDTP